MIVSSVAQVFLLEAIYHFSVKKPKNQKIKPPFNFQPKVQLNSWNSQLCTPEMFVLVSLCPSSPSRRRHTRCLVTAVKFRAFKCLSLTCPSPSLETQIGRPELGRSAPIGRAATWCQVLLCYWSPTHQLSCLSVFFSQTSQLCVCVWERECACVCARLSSLRDVCGWEQSGRLNQVVWLLERLGVSGMEARGSTVKNQHRPTHVIEKKCGNTKWEASPELRSKF